MWLPSLYLLHAVSNTVIMDAYCGFFHSICCMLYQTVSWWMHNLASFTLSAACCIKQCHDGCMMRLPSLYLPHPVSNSVFQRLNAKWLSCLCWRNELCLSLFLVHGWPTALMQYKASWTLAIFHSAISGKVTHSYSLVFNEHTALITERIACILCTHPAACRFLTHLSAVMHL